MSTCHHSRRHVVQADCHHSRQPNLPVVTIRDGFLSPFGLARRDTEKNSGPSDIGDRFICLTRARPNGDKLEMGSARHGL